jgi:general secretion pathway protein I
MFRRDPAFTLIEVLVALFVTAITAVSLLDTFAGGLRAGDSSRQRTYAMLLAQSKLATVGSEIPLVPGESRGRFDDRFGWQVVIDASGSREDGDGARGDVEVMEVTVRVSWPPGDNDAFVVLTSARTARGLSGRVAQ